MKIVIAPDSFKGSLSAKEVCLAIEKGIHRVDPMIKTISIPLADGGEGTVENLVHATQGKLFEAVVKDPLGRSIQAFYGALGDGDTCVIEVAGASGLTLLKLEERNPLLTTSFGTGELIRHALDQGFRKFIIGLGGSATNDAGAGIIQALGIKLLDSSGDELGYGGGSLLQLAEIDMTHFDERVRQSHFTIASDVNNPFIGPLGASAIFGPQKGASPEMVERLDLNLTHFADVVLQKTKISIHQQPGSGAAGGIGGALHAFFPSRMEKGIEIVMQATGLADQLKEADLVITGEGQIDSQTIHGKTPFGIASLAKQHGVPTIALAGSVGEGIEMLRDCGIESVWSIVSKPMSLQEAMTNGFELLTDAAEQVVRVFLLGLRNKR